ncbi:MAG TPA: 50S ribosomal protein L1 [Candidatus Aenigmarchaeota archaeon]|nr:50S ribosomal protein L1 [Candidatus Aenigmarchaeota archaeon]
MRKEDLLKALEEARKKSKPRKFVQSVDLIIPLKDIDLRKPENRIEEYVTLPHGPGKRLKICAFVGKGMEGKAKEACDFVIRDEEFGKWEKKEIKKLVREYDYFIAQADLMPSVAAKFGKYLGALGKLPSPKSGSIFPMNADLKPIVEKLRKTVRIVAKKQPVVSCIIGKENMKDEEIAENAMAVYEALVHKLPEGKKQIRGVYVKLTMGPPVRVW